MIVVIFEVQFAGGKKEAYFKLAEKLKPELGTIPGFISGERFESLSNEGKFVSLSFWESMEAVEQWRNTEAHRLAQMQGHNSIIAEFRIRVAQVLRDYTMTERAEAPADSRVWLKK